jgi:hypothetical protein
LLSLWVTPIEGGHLSHMCRLFYLTIILKLVTRSFPAVFSLQNREV